jgi:hypothetical protein
MEFDLVFYRVVEPPHVGVSPRVGKQVGDALVVLL